MTLSQNKKSHPHGWLNCFARWLAGMPYAFAFRSRHNSANPPSATRLNVAGSGIMLTPVIVNEEIPPAVILSAEYPPNVLAEPTGITSKESAVNATPPPNVLVI